MTEIIEWCNNNSGFTDALLSAVGLIATFIALYISIKTSIHQYRRKIKIEYQKIYRYDNELFKILINVINVGFLPFNISEIGIATYKRFKLFPLRYEMLWNLNTIVEPAKIFSHDIFIETAYDRMKTFFKYKRVYCVVVCSDKKIYKKYIGTINSLLKQMKASDN